MKETKNMVPFEDHYYPESSKQDDLVMIQVAKRENYDGEVIDCKNYPFDRWQLIKENEVDGKLVSVVSNPVTGKEYCAIGTSVFGAVATVCYRDKLLTKSDRLEYQDVLYKFDGKYRYRNRMEVMDGMLVIRNYCFHNLRENYGQGWYECSRFIFNGTQIAYETRNRFDENFDMRSYRYATNRAATKKQNSGKTEKECASIGYNTVIVAPTFECCKESSKAAVFQVYPWMKNMRGNYWDNIISTTGIADRIERIPKTAKVYKNVPENIKQDLTVKHYYPRTDEDLPFCNEPSATSLLNMSGNLYFQLYQEPGLSCYYSQFIDENNEEVAGVRVYFSKDEVFLFKWNPVEKCYASVPLRRFGQEPFNQSYFVLPKEKNGTMIDRLVGLFYYEKRRIETSFDLEPFDEWNPFGGPITASDYETVKTFREKIRGKELIYLLSIPAAEKAAKVGLNLHVEDVYTHDGRHRYGTPVKRNVSENKAAYYQSWGMPEDVVKDIENAKTITDILCTTKDGIELLLQIAPTWDVDLMSMMSIMRHPKLQCVSKALRPVIVYKFRYNSLASFDDMLEGDILYYERLIKACKKNGNISEFETKAHLFEDYSKMRKEFEIIKPRLVEAGVDISEYNFPEYPKPAHLHHFHDAVAREVTRYKDLIDVEKAKETSRQITEFSETAEYTQFLEVEDEKNFTILPATSGEDLVREGSFLHHCVGTYRERMAKKESYIYFLRKSNDQETPFYTMEVKKHRWNNKYFLNQCYTFHDSTEKSEACRKFITEWAENHNIDIQCAV